MHKKNTTKYNKTNFFENDQLKSNTNFNVASYSIQCKNETINVVSFVLFRFEFNQSIFSIKINAVRVQFNEKQHLSNIEKKTFFFNQRKIETINVVLFVFFRFDFNVKLTNVLFFEFHDFNIVFANESETSNSKKRTLHSNRLTRDAIRIDALKLFLFENNVIKKHVSVKMFSKMIEKKSFLKSFVRFFKKYDVKTLLQTFLRKSVKIYIAYKKKINKIRFVNLNKSDETIFDEKKIEKMNF